MIAEKPALNALLRLGNAIAKQKNFGNPENRLKKRAFCEKLLAKVLEKTDFDGIVFCYQTYLMT
ncbi:MAG: hypothetical protein MR963_00050 [Bacteroidales bacterium]|nr:hypothetical protein [Bacteroidales bacterium]